MGKVILIVAFLLIANIGFSLGNIKPMNRYITDKDDKYLLQVNALYQVLHNVKIEIKYTDKGVNLQVKLITDNIQKVLKNDSWISQESFSTYFESVDVSLSEFKNGWLIRFYSSNEDLVSRLQYSGQRLWHEFLQKKMYFEMRISHENRKVGSQYYVRNHKRS